MPQNKFQDFILTLMMAGLMVYAMICYNICLNIGGMQNAVFLKAFLELKIMWPVAVMLEMLVAGRLAMKLTFRLFTPGRDNPAWIILGISAMTVCVMCPLMSLAATFLFKHPGNQIVAVWLQTLAMNFPMALCFQLFFCGPFVRMLFRRIFAKQLAPSQPTADRA